MESLPTDLLLEIFPRLPCKDIVVCKCVRRKWYDLLSHPNFSRRYAKNPPFTSIFLFKHLCDDNTAYAFLVEIAADGEVIKTPLTTNIPNFYLNTHSSPTVIRDSSSIIGSCNGLLFFLQTSRAIGSNSCSRFSDFERVYCYNPFSGECVPLARGELYSKMWSVRYRIGYIPSAGNIKLLAFINDEHPAYILTVGIDSKWRALEDRLDYQFKFCAVSFNGVHHWIHENACLKTFDFAKEKIGAKWELPRRSAKETFTIKLAVLNNRISLIERLRRLGLVIWTMEEYGVAESWSKKTLIGDYFPSYLEATLANGDLLFSNAYGDGFKFVNPEKEDTKEIDVYDCTTKTGRLYVAEFAPKFCSLDHCWNI